MSMDEFIKLLPSRQRRSLLKGLTNEQRILMEHVRQSRKENGGKPAPVKSHVRDMIVIPEMLGLNLQLHSGKEYVSIEIQAGDDWTFRRGIRHYEPEGCSWDTWDRCVSV